MKQTLKRIIRNVKSINGNSLAEFATTTALMGQKELKLRSP